MSEDLANQVRFPKGTRWECRGCAACCSSGFDLGPVEPSVIAALSEAGIESRWPPAAKAPWATQRQGPSGQSAWFLRQEQGRCVFLRDDRRCAIHAELGPAFKPGFCREFPYHLVHDPRGIVAVVRPDCEGWHESFLDGPEISEEDVRAVAAAPRVVPRRTFAPQSVSVLGQALSLEVWLDREAEILAALSSLQDPSLPSLAASLRAAVSSAASVPLPAPEAARADAALSALYGALGQVLRAVLAQPGPPDRVQFVAEMASEIEAVRGRSRGSQSEPLGRYLSLQIVSSVMARHWQPYGPVEAGLGAILLGLCFGCAASDGTLERFDRSYRRWLRLAGNGVVSMVLSRARPALVELFLHLA